MDKCSRCGKAIEPGHHWLVIVPFIVIHMVCRKQGDEVVRGGVWA